MNTRVLSLGASLLVPLGGVLAGGTAMAQAATGNTVMAQLATRAADTDMVGRWVHDPRGNAIGSVRSLAEDGRIAVLMIGSYFQPGSHETRVPVSALSETSRGIVLREGTVEALNTRGRD